MRVKARIIQYLGGMNKSLFIVASVLSLVGLIINVGTDRDNVYDMTLAGLWTLTLVVALAGALVGNKRNLDSTVSYSASTTKN